MVEEEMRRLQYSAEERTKRFQHVGPFRLSDWLAAVPPATPEELEEMEALLRQREEERELNLAREAGFAP